MRENGNFRWVYIFGRDTQWRCRFGVRYLNGVRCLGSLLNDAVRRVATVFDKCK